MTKEEVIEEVKNYENYPNGLSKECRNYIIKTLEQGPSSSENPTGSTTLVSLDVYKEVAKERDIAIEQLHELGYEFGCKIEPTVKNDLAQERYQDLIEYFGDEKVAKTILESKKEFKAWLERLRWNVKRVDELAEELQQIKVATKNDLAVVCIDRAELLKAMDACNKFGCRKPKGYYVTFVRYEDMVKCVKNMPQVTPQEPRCKECKWWKDSDGKYRRGIGAESRCPINSHAVYCGDGSCYMFSPKADMRGEEV